MNEDQIELPPEFGKGKPIEMPEGSFFRPLTEKEKQGFTEEEWAAIKASLSATGEVR